MGRLVDAELPTFPPASAFWITVRKRVFDHFAATGKDPKFATGMIYRYATAIMAMIISYSFMLYFRNNAGLSLFFAAVLGWAVSQVPKSLSLVQYDDHARFFSLCFYAFTKSVEMDGNIQS